MNYKTQWELFFDKVDKNGPIHPYTPELGQCWIWTGSRRTKGHGYFWYEGAVRCAHRFSWLLIGQELSSDLEICHFCDRGWCVNAIHLFEGTHEENMNDMVSKGRGRNPQDISEQARGSRNPSAILVEADVIKMRALRSQIPRPSVRNIAALFPQVSRGTIKRILLRQSWNHIP